MPNFTHLFEVGNSLLLINGSLRMWAYPTNSELWLVEKIDAPVADDFVWPFNPDDITDEWGYRPPPIPGLSDFHSGCDWPKSAGTPIKAAGSGTVIQVKNLSEVGSPGGRSWGNRVIIDHGDIGGDRLYTAYAHMQSDDFPIVSVNDTVEAGDTIGYVGMTGSATGNHLHFVTFIGGLQIGTVDFPRNCVNPRVFMQAYNPSGNIA